ncbi:MAG: type VI secretion protein, partial [Acidimicrobiales bacterium]
MTPPTSVPNGPLGRYLLHPGQDTSTVVHHVLHVLAALGRTALPVLVAVVALLVVARIALALTRRQRAGGGHLVTVAPGPEVEPSGAEALWNGLHGVLRRGGLAGLVSGRPHAAFELGFSAGRLRFGLWVPATVSAGRVARVVEASWPGAVTEVLPAEAPLPGGAGIVGGELRLAGPEWFSLRVDQPADPYRLLLAALSGMGSGEAGVVQVLARPATRRRYGRCRKAAIALRTGRPRSKLVRFIDFWMTKGVPHPSGLSADPTRAADVRAITEKAASLCFEATVRCGIVTPAGGHGARQQLKAEGHGLVGAFAMFDGRNHLTRRRLARPWQALCARRLGRGDLYSVGELAALAHLPVDRTVAGLSRAGAHAVAPPPEVSGDGKVLGRAEGGARRPVGVSAADARQHLHVLGATGSGKSTLLTNLVLQY